MYILASKRSELRVSRGIPFIMIDGCRQAWCHLSSSSFFRDDYDDV